MARSEEPRPRVKGIEGGACGCGSGDGAWCGGSGGMGDGEKPKAKSQDPGSRELKGRGDCGAGPTLLAMARSQKYRANHAGHGN